MDESPDLRKVSHIGLWLAAGIMAVFIYLLWTATHNNGDTTTKFTPGSVDNHKEFTYYPLSMGIMGCDYIRGVDGAQIKNDKNADVRHPAKR